MRCELPQLARCCFCFPLRYGLIVWAYVKLVLVITTGTELYVFSEAQWVKPHGPDLETNVCINTNIQHYYTRAVSLVLTILLIVNALSMIISEFKTNGCLIIYFYPLFIIAIIFTIFFFVDLIFHVIFIISAHMKEHKKMKLFYIEALFGLALYVFGFFFCFIFLLLKYNFLGLLFGLTIWCFFLWLIMSQVCLIILVRSEVLKLERSTKGNYEFTNHAADEERTKVERINIIVEENAVA